MDDTNRIGDRMGIEASQNTSSVKYNSVLSQNKDAKPTPTPTLHRFNPLTKPTSTNSPHPSGINVRGSILDKEYLSRLSIEKSKTPRGNLNSHPQHVTRQSPISPHQSGRASNEPTSNNANNANINEPFKSPILSDTLFSPDNLSYKSKTRATPLILSKYGGGLCGPVKRKARRDVSTLISIPRFDPGYATPHQSLHDPSAKPPLHTHSIGQLSSIYTQTVLETPFDRRQIRNTTHHTVGVIRYDSIKHQNSHHHSSMASTTIISSTQHIHQQTIAPQESEIIRNHVNKVLNYPLSAIGHSFHPVKAQKIHNNVDHSCQLVDLKKGDIFHHDTDHHNHDEDKITGKDSKMKSNYKIPLTWDADDNKHTIYEPYNRINTNSQHSEWESIDQTHASPSPPSRKLSQVGSFMSQCLAGRAVQFQIPDVTVPQNEKLKPTSVKKLISSPPDGQCNKALDEIKATASPLLNQSNQTNNSEIETTKPNIPNPVYYSPTIVLIDPSNNLLNTQRENDNGGDDDDIANISFKNNHSRHSDNHIGILSSRHHGAGVVALGVRSPDLFSIISGTNQPFNDHEEISDAINHYGDNRRAQNPSLPDLPAPTIMSAREMLANSRLRSSSNRTYESTSTRLDRSSLPGQRFTNPSQHVPSTPPQNSQSNTSSSQRESVQPSSSTQRRLDSINSAITALMLPSPSSPPPSRSQANERPTSHNNISLLRLSQRSQGPNLLSQFNVPSSSQSIQQHPSSLHTALTQEQTSSMHLHNLRNTSNSQSMQLYKRNTRHKPHFILDTPNLLEQHSSSSDKKKQSLPSTPLSNMIQDISPPSHITSAQRPITPVVRQHDTSNVYDRRHEHRTPYAMGTGRDHSLVSPEYLLSTAASTMQRGRIPSRYRTDTTPDVHTQGTILSNRIGVRSTQDTIDQSPLISSISVMNRRYGNKSTSLSYNRILPLSKPSEFHIESLNDDFYLSLLDWSNRRNIVLLGSRQTLYCWNMNDSSIMYNNTTSDTNDTNDDDHDHHRHTNRGIYRKSGFINHTIGDDITHIYHNVNDSGTTREPFMTSPGRPNNKNTSTKHHSVPLGVKSTYDNDEPNTSIYEIDCSDILKRYSGQGTGALITSVTWCDDVIAIGSDDGFITLFDPIKEAEISRFPAHQSRIGAMAFSSRQSVDPDCVTLQIQRSPVSRSKQDMSDFTRVASHLSSRNKTSKKNSMNDSLTSSSSSLSNPKHNMHIQPHSYQQSLNLLASGGRDRVIRLWDIRVNNTQSSYMVHNIQSNLYTRYTMHNQLYKLSHHIYSGSNGSNNTNNNNHTINRLYDSNDIYNIYREHNNDDNIIYHDDLPLFDINYKSLFTIKSHKHEICGLKWSYDGSQLASGSNDSTVKIWSIYGDFKSYNVHTAAVKALAWSPFQTYILASGGGTACKRICVYDTRCDYIPDQYCNPRYTATATTNIQNTQQTTVRQYMNTNPLLNSISSNFNQYIYNSDAISPPNTRDIQTNQQSRQATSPRDNSSEHVLGVGTNLLSSYLVQSVSESRPNRSSSSLSPRSSSYHSTNSRSPASSPDLSRNQDKPCALLNWIDTGNQVCSLVWSKVANEIISGQGFSQNKLVVWSYPNLTPLGELKGHTNRPLYTSLSPDGTIIASASGDRTLRFWTIYKK